MAWLCPYFQRLLSLTGRDAVLDKDKAVKPDSEDVKVSAPVDPSHGHPRLLVPPSRQTGRHPVLHVSFAANLIR